MLSRSDWVDVKWLPKQTPPLIRRRTGNSRLKQKRWESEEKRRQGCYSCHKRHKTQTKKTTLLNVLPVCLLIYLLIFTERNQEGQEWLRPPSGFPRQRAGVLNNIKTVLLSTFFSSNQHLPFRAMRNERSEVSWLPASQEENTENNNSHFITEFSEVCLVIS